MQIAVDTPRVVVGNIGLRRLASRCSRKSAARRPTLPVILLTGDISDAVDATSRGVFGYLTKPFGTQILLEKIDRALQLRSRPCRPAKRGQPWARAAMPGWRGSFSAGRSRMAALMADARMVAASDTSVLIRGESGSGKEVLARAIHRASPRAKGPFVAINCGAIPEQLLESELFGHAKGAFTGAATSRVGLFQTANGGTLFLDEIGNMPLALQVELAARAAGAHRAPRSVPPRPSRSMSVCFSATHRDLDAAMAQGQFREDLYRLDVVSLTLPRLDERREDIPLLGRPLRRPARRQSTASRSTALRRDALEALATASWPGNVRQLFNVVEQELRPYFDHR